MSTTCPNGHESDWKDWCSVCGERLDAAVTPAAPVPPSQGSADQPSPEASPGPSPDEATSGPKCENCGVARHSDDVFCESCGYDFASGSLPDAEDSALPATAPAKPMHAKVMVDPDFFASTVGDADLLLPDPAPPVQIIPLPGTRVRIGRQSTSRGVFPEIDLRDLTSDPAVSTQHAMLERLHDGTWTLTDLGSTNGTYLTAEADEAIDPGAAIPLAAGSVFFLGAWTRIEVVETAN